MPFLLEKLHVVRLIIKRELPVVLNRDGRISKLEKGARPLQVQRRHIWPG